MATHIAQAPAARPLTSLRREFHLQAIHDARWRPQAPTFSLEPPERVNAFGPASFSERLKATARLLSAHGAYAQALSAMWLHQVGTGMLVGSFMVLISGLGSTTPAQTVMTLVLVDLLSHIVPPLVSLHGAHLRDNADAQARIKARTTPHNYARGLLYTGLGDVAVAAAMFGLAWGAAYGGLAGPALLVPLGVVRTLQTCKSIYEFNLFNSFKARLPAPDLPVPGANQHYTITSGGIRFVVLSMEANVGATIFSVASAAVVFAARSLTSTPVFHLAALTGIAAGGLFASLPKLVFLPYVAQAPS
jgi:hypothetical protein